MAKKNVVSIKKEEVLQIKVTLRDTSPAVWRRLLVSSQFDFEQLHSVFQHTMGWQMSHLYDFQVDQVRYAEPDDFDTQTPAILSTSIGKTLKAGTRFLYNYDFGDGWRHECEVENILALTDEMNFPICIGGENACPPEDCGGAHGYEVFKEAIKDPTHSEHASLLMWVGGFFDPLTFDPNVVNRNFLWLIDWHSDGDDQGLYLPNYNQE